MDIIIYFWARGRGEQRKGHAKHAPHHGECEYEEVGVDDVKLGDEIEHHRAGHAGAHTEYLQDHLLALHAAYHSAKPIASEQRIFASSVMLDGKHRLQNNSPPKTPAVKVMP